MLGVNKYTRKYIDACRSKVDLDVAIYRKMVNAARKKNGTSDTSLNSAIESFEYVFFNNMVLILDALFVHRIRAIEGKDGNPLNEVRILCNSIINNNSILSPDKTIKLIPAK